MKFGMHRLATSYWGSNGFGSPKNGGAGSRRSRGTGKTRVNRWLDEIINGDTNDDWADVHAEVEHDVAVAQYFGFGG